jgi:hypothetical protein
MNADKVRSPREKTWRIVRSIFVVSASFCVYLWLALLFSCDPKPTDLRTLVPADTLVYLETKDLGVSLEPAMSGNDGSKQDVSGLKGIQFAISITAIDTSEQRLNDEQSNAQIKPKFVAVADTHAWHFQAVRFAEEKLGAFVEKVYGSKPTLDEPERDGGRDMTWTAADGRRAYASVTGSIVYFSNDRESLDKTLAVRTGAASLASTGKIHPPPIDAIASGYVSTQGVAQIADLMGLNAAASAGDDPQVQSAVAAILPQLVREMVTDVTWSEKKTDNGVADTYEIRTPDNVASALKDTQPSDLDERLRNTIVALLAGSKLDEKTRSQVADAIVASVKAGEGAQTKFGPTGMERTTTSSSGLVGLVLNQVEAAVRPNT